MNDRPYFNEPGVEDSSDPATEHAWKNYNKVITHETLRVAVIENLAEVVKNPRQLPEQIEQKMLRHFFSNFESYVKRAEDLKVLDGKPMAVRQWSTMDYGCEFGRFSLSVHFVTKS
jgi:hypothetical protein